MIPLAIQRHAAAFPGPGQWRMAWVAVAVLSPQLLGAADYYVASQGADDGPGTTPATAWRTLDRVGRASLQPGDRVLFEAGKTFTGTLRLGHRHAGTRSAPTIFTSFGVGRATLQAGAGTGIAVRDAGGICIENLSIVGAGRTNNSGFGVLCENTLPGTNLLEHLRLANLDIQGFGQHGLMVTGTEAGFRHVRVDHCVMHDNLRGGMEIAGKLAWDSPRYAHADVEVRDCSAFDNTGDPDYQKNHSGSGLVLYQVDGGLMDHCRAWNNGALCRNRGGGPVGIWTCASRKVVIQHCESFSNKTEAADGGGFDIDGGSEDCVLQYNFSHDNDGPGLMVYTYPYASHADRGNIVRFNVSAHDSRRSRTYAGLWVRNDGHGMTQVHVYNNTVVSGPWTDQAAAVHGEGVEATFRNNLLVSASASVPLRVLQPNPQLRFENNLYWRSGSPVEIVWGETPYRSLRKWSRETGQESRAGRRLGFFSNPRLPATSGNEAPGSRPARDLLQAFRPAAGSMAQSGGLDVAAILELHPPPSDLAGRPLATRAPWPLGAFAP